MSPVPDEAKRLAAYGRMVEDAMNEVTEAETNFGDADWFGGATAVRTIQLYDGTEWEISVGRSSAEQVSA